MDKTTYVRLKEAVLDKLNEMQVGVATIAFDGSGDSGCVEDILLFGREVDVENLVTVETLDAVEAKKLFDAQLPNTWADDGSDEPKMWTLRQAIDDLADAVLFGDGQFAGWENDDGAYGEIVIAVRSRRVYVEVNARYTTISHDEYEV